MKRPVTEKEVFELVNGLLSEGALRTFKERVDKLFHPTCSVCGCSEELAVREPAKCRTCYDREWVRKKRASA